MKFSNPLRFLRRGRPSTSVPVFTPPVDQAPPSVTLKEILPSEPVGSPTLSPFLHPNSPLLPSPSPLPRTAPIPLSAPSHHLSGTMKPHKPTSMKPSPPTRPHPRHHPSLQPLYPSSARPSRRKLAHLPRPRRLGGHHQSHKPPLPSACPSLSMPTHKDTRMLPEGHQTPFERGMTPLKPDGVQEPRRWLRRTSCLALSGMFAHRASYFRSFRTVESLANLPSPTPSPASPRKHKRTPILVPINEARFLACVPSLLPSSLKPNRPLFSPSLTQLPTPSKISPAALTSPVKPYTVNVAPLRIQKRTPSQVPTDEARLTMYVRCPLSTD